MAGERVLPGLGLTAFWVYGDDGYNTDMDNNLRKLSVIAQLSVLSRVGALPGSPIDGDIYLLTTDGSINARDDGAWVSYAPEAGWLAHVLDEQAYYFYNGSVWGALIPGTLVADLATLQTNINAEAAARAAADVALQVNIDAEAARAIAAEAALDVRVDDIEANVQVSGPGIGSPSGLPEHVIVDGTVDWEGKLISADLRGQGQRSIRAVAAPGGLTFREDVGGVPARREPASSEIYIPEASLPVAGTWVKIQARFYTTVDPGVEVGKVDTITLSSSEQNLTYQFFENMVVTNSVGGAVLDEGVDYELDYNRGYITGLGTGIGIVANCTYDGLMQRIDYTFVSPDTMSVGSQIGSNEVARFADMWKDPINTGKIGLWYIFRWTRGYEMTALYNHKNGVRVGKEDEWTRFLDQQNLYLAAAKSALLGGANSMSHNYGDSTSAQGGVLAPLNNEFPDDEGGDGGSRDTDAYWDTADTATRNLVPEVGGHTRESYGWLFAASLASIYGGAVGTRHVQRNWGIGGTKFGTGSSVTGGVTKWNANSVNRLPFLTAYLTAEKTADPTLVQFVFINFGANLYGETGIVADGIQIVEACLAAAADVYPIMVTPCYRNTFWVPKPDVYMDVCRQLVTAAELAGCAHDWSPWVVYPDNLGSFGFTTYQQGECGLTHHWGVAEGRARAAQHANLIRP